MRGDFSPDELLVGWFFLGGDLEHGLHIQIASTEYGTTALLAVGVF